MPERVAALSTAPFFKTRKVRQVVGLDCRFVRLRILAWFILGVRAKVVDLDQGIMGVRDIWDSGRTPQLRDPFERSVTRGGWKRTDSGFRAKLPPLMLGR
jgi:hypothetical protein